MDEKLINASYLKDLAHEFVGWAKITHNYVMAEDRFNFQISESFND